ncbi:helix-turn-helix domain-containing protein [Phreatobacter stygius]|uniref:Transcriptional regulator n=1 Tax=Phreatobacter stygius TaxID=1940610 RepID=A0A4D7B520_9HYPH|nr:helix-turn-helix domain-containing protein [Phreatobacter stygius]QCI65548.1 transcriptional regulator [Phreatobacter stygius]
MHAADILALVKKSRFRFLTNIARASNIAPTTLRTALRRPQRRAEIAIATAVGKKLHELWPERWDKTGNRLSAPGRSRIKAAAATSRPGDRRAA